MIYDLAIVGAGPCGISAAVEAKNSKIENIIVFEKASEHSQTIRTFYKDGKRVDKSYKGQVGETLGSVEFFDGTKESTLEYFDEILRKAQISVTYGCEVESIKKDGENYKISTPKGEFVAKNCLICIGKMGKPNKPSYKIPSSLAKIVNFNTDKCTKDEKILVVGGGNSAAEYAVDLAKDNKVTLCYRQAKFSRLNDINLENVENLAQKNELNLKLATDIEELLEAGEKVLVKFNNGESVEFDRIIYAIGGSTPVDFLNRCSVELEDGLPLVDEKLRSKNGIYIGGDIISKNGSSIVTSFNNAFHIITDIKNRG